jgi:hypothetical protein
VPAPTLSAPDASVASSKKDFEKRRRAEEDERRAHMREEECRRNGSQERPVRGRLPFVPLRDERDAVQAERIEAT